VENIATLTAYSVLNLTVSKLSELVLLDLLSELINVIQK